MDKAWIDIIKVTGAVGVVGALFSLLLTQLFSEQIVNLLGSERMFYLIMVIVGGLLIALIVSIFKPKESSNKGDSDSTNAPTKKVNVTYDKSTHNGDNNF
ncbi:MAG: hypothetical protein GY694_01450 [Gammaproteobacteria bacterium]|nr:hypothetical protein [Gammaproteobacteria bacterium]MCP4056404.1 hypothetical protein [Pseudoalteromonas sp.]